MQIFKTIKSFVTPDRKSNDTFRFLLPAEWAMLVYAVFTVCMVLFTSTNLADSETMLWERFHIVFTTFALCVVYRLWPCKLMAGVRIAVLLILLTWWYLDTYDLSKQFPNLDHVFAGMDQALFGCQPALLWCETYSSHIVAELMDFGYVMFFPMTAWFIYDIMFRKYNEFNRVCFIILASFYIYYVIYDILPVTGPQYYYLAAGIENIAAGNFPDVANYFETHIEALRTPGYENGLFHNLLELAHKTGERPTAAFPSSHVGLATITMIVAMKLKEWRFTIVWTIPYILLCLSTVYIQAHYAVDAIAGFLFAIPVEFCLDRLYKKLWGKGRSHKN